MGIQGRIAFLFQIRAMASIEAPTEEPVLYVKRHDMKGKKWADRRQARRAKRIEAQEAADAAEESESASEYDDGVTVTRREKKKDGKQQIVEAEMPQGNV